MVVGAAAERMLEYTLDVVKLEPGDRKRSTKTVQEEKSKYLKGLTTREENEAEPLENLLHYLQRVWRSYLVRQSEVAACLGWGMSSADGLAGLRYMRSRS